MSQAKFKEIPIYTKSQVDEWRKSFLIAAIVMVVLAFCLGYIIGHFDMDDFLRYFD